VFELKPSIPTQKDEYAVVNLLPVTAGTIHEPWTEVTEPLEPVTAYPLQFVLYQLLPLVLLAHIPGAIIGPAKANAGLNAANSMSEPTRNMENVEDFIGLHLFLSCSNYNCRSTVNGRI
jgi:hypothetical protein